MCISRPDVPRSTKPPHFVAPNITRYSIACLRFYGVNRPLAKARRSADKLALTECRSPRKYSTTKIPQLADVNPFPRKPVRKKVGDQFPWEHMVRGPLSAVGKNPCCNQIVRSYPNKKNIMSNLNIQCLQIFGKGIIV